MVVMKSITKHWSVDTTELKKEPIAYKKWNLENAINFGMRDSKINESDLREHFGTLRIDPHKRKFLSLLIS